MRPFLGALLLFFILFFSENEASWTPRFTKKKKQSESSDNAEGSSVVVDLVDIPAAPVMRGRPKGKKTRDLNRSDSVRESPEVRDSRLIKRSGMGELTYSGQQQAFQDTQDLNYDKDAKEYGNYKLYEKYTKVEAPPAYPPLPTVNYGNYYSGHGAHLGPYENSFSQYEQAPQNLQLQALQHQQQFPGAYSGGSEPWLSQQQPHADGAHNSGGSEPWLSQQLPHNDGTQNHHFHGGNSGGGSFHGGHPGGYRYD